MNMRSAVIVLLLVVCVFGQNVNQPLNVTGEDINIERPCNTFDTQCIRRYFNKNSNCKPKHGPVPDPFFRKRSRVFIPTLNLTVEFKDVTYRGLNGRIEEFYVNRETDKVVLAVDFRNLLISTNNAFFRFHRLAREPIVTTDYFTILFRSISVTMVIPQRKNLKLQRGETFTFIDEAAPEFRIGPNIFNNPDPTVQQAAVEFVPNFATINQEALLAEGSFYIANYIQYALCDFGLNLL